VVEVGVGDEEIVLADGELRPAADVERDVQRRHGDAGLVPAHRDPLDGVPFHLHALALHLGARAPVLLLVCQRAVQHRQKPAPLASASAAAAGGGGGGLHWLPSGEGLEPGAPGGGAREDTERREGEERGGRHFRAANWGGGMNGGESPMASGGAAGVLGFGLLVSSRARLEDNEMQGLILIGWVPKLPNQNNDKPKFRLVKIRVYQC